MSPPGPGDGPVRLQKVLAAVAGGDLRRAIFENRVDEVLALSRVGFQSYRIQEAFAGPVDGGLGFFYAPLAVCADAQFAVGVDVH